MQAYLGRAVDEISQPAADVAAIAGFGRAVEVFIDREGGQNLWPANGDGE